jgi:large subunit ribosomal protein L15e
MVNGLAYYLRQAWKKPDTETLRKRMIEWRHGEAFVRVEKPLRLDKARALGYKAKKGIIVVRVRVVRGGHKRSRPNKGRRSKRMGIRVTLKENYKAIAERRVADKYPNMEVLNSYWIGRDGINYFYEVILVDRCAPEIKSDKQLSFITKKKSTSRAYRGLTSAGIKSRGLRHSTERNPKARNPMKFRRRQRLRHM